MGRGNGEGEMGSERGDPVGRTRCCGTGTSEADGMVDLMR